MEGVEAGEMGGAASLSHRLGKCSNLYLMRSSGALTLASGLFMANLDTPLTHTPPPGGCLRYSHTKL